MRVLGIETSCDETAAAVVTSEGVVLSDVVRSQVAAHAPFGGVVPEIASRDHATAVAPVIAEALTRAQCSIEQIDAIAATFRPGLAGALMVGLQTAKGMAWATQKKFIGVDHLVAHILAVFLQPSDTSARAHEFPFIALLVSGGHTALYRVDGPVATEMYELGATRDDAAGEAFDKAAKALGLGYPGGPAIDRLAHEGNALACPVRLPRSMAQRGSLEFSFSGLKTALQRHIVAAGAIPSGQALTNLCAAYQDAIVETLVQKTIAAAIQQQIPRVVIAGGVAANRGLRTKMAEACARRNVELAATPLRYCTDNAAMIAFAGAHEIMRGSTSPFDLAPATTTSLPRVTRKGGGVRS